ncbi:hypothetical protein BDV27DRAFT_125016 [Aspergillus caelatus]|uniref:Uncharacterized protein n=2 Tax=Aspergillus subgen. Circumdati TaxID=2720871 RepID=A0A5N7AA36_9EURO|nr:uncharacterized protein BDV27DRAFT_125016 [Aspergillus caelatus]KAE8366704.1 hypothetical protein BDV27DRAFT_125016 [Aspergillus caelatus]KAE8412707.1 hypothetical protein BDV36DRAFT_53304 [Aspergillus pseudocaelatus]
MSAESLPITLAAFVEAIKELPLSSVYAKASELSNSISHLRRSNQELKAFMNESCDTEAEKRELENYITENEEVIRSMHERNLLLKSEIEGRGQRWIEMGNIAPDARTDENHQPSVSEPITNGAAAERPNGAQQELSTTRSIPDTQNGHEQDGVFL